MRPIRFVIARDVPSRPSKLASRPSCSRASSYRHDQTQWRRAASSSANDSSAKPYYVTTPIFYVNASPHVGHMYTMLLSDAIKRWQNLRNDSGPQALLCTGTDEHGMKVQRAAAQQGISPKELCDTNAEKFRELANACGIDYDFFIRTTDTDHMEAVQHFWYLLQEKGYIYETTHSGWYCVSDECFYAEDEVERIMVPQTGRIIMASVSSGNEVEWTEERNYHFRMTALKDQLLKFYNDNPDWIVPRSRMNEVIGWVTNHLEDLSISRPVKRLDWGIGVPDDPSQTVYVWVDALVNYLTKAGFPQWAPGEEHKGGWPADVHVIGKDIVRFHGVYWPALLMAVGIQPPKQLLCHAHWTMSKKKMSKSIGNVVNPFFAIDRWGLDTMRYFMLRNGGIEDDADYENSLVLARYDKDLRSIVGNTVSRITRSPRWSAAECVAWAQENRDKLLSLSSDDEEQIPLVVKMMRNVPSNMTTAMNQLNPSEALRHAMDVLAETNKYLQEKAPWSKEITTEDRNEVIYHSAEALRVVGILLQPFMPEKTGQLLDMLGVKTDKRTFAQAVIGADFDYGTPEDPEILTDKSRSTLFPRAAVEK